MKLELIGPPRENEPLCETLGDICDEFKCDVDQREKVPAPPLPADTPAQRPESCARLRVKLPGRYDDVFAALSVVSLDSSTLDFCGKQFFLRLPKPFSLDHCKLIRWLQALLIDKFGVFDINSIVFENSTSSTPKDMTPVSKAEALRNLKTLFIFGPLRRLPLNCIVTSPVANQ
uniref:Uncharacterized protein n=1 Tax=Glossina pallidipes TaxID=7398 RepID=A0A1A9Z5Q4_GLOPL